jgi:hypothetical protein
VVFWVPSPFSEAAAGVEGAGETVVAGIFAALAEFEATFGFGDFFGSGQGRFVKRKTGLQWGGLG